MASITELRSLIREVACSGVVLSDPRLDYVTVQIDSDTWEQIQKLEPLHYSEDDVYTQCGKSIARWTGDWRLVTWPVASECACRHVRRLHRVGDRHRPL